MALRQQQELKQLQKLSPLQMQVIKLVELTSVELEDKIKQEVEDNPALDTIDSDYEHASDEAEGDGMPEEDNVSQEEIILGDYFSEDDVPDFRIRQSTPKGEPSYIEVSVSEETSLNESLLEQLRLHNFDSRNEIIAEYIIGNLDESGYLLCDLQSVADDLLFQQNLDVSVEELTQVLSIIQEMDPPGVGARELKECLLLQLKRMTPGPSVTLAMNVLENYFEEFSRKHYDKILRAMNISPDDLRGVIDLIVSLNPKPGNTMGDAMETAMANITPDFIVESYNGEVSMYLNNGNIPLLKINRDFSELLQGYAQNKKSMSADDKQAMMFMKQKVDSARWFIDAVKQRQNTLQRTMEAIVQIQYDFFLTEDETLLKPMILKDVAEKTGFDISTISRVSNSKYVQTNSGIYPLKYFFSEAMQNEAGEDISSREVKYILRESIESEDPSKPLTDEQLTKILNQKGYVIARRTTAKYREQLNIPVARLRKKI
ncbi:MAG TPA: RNA polymerase sigma-54 factor [Porphyromonadaceae bacterium]|nr:RNA polymerase sigma-54 factor [Porphyromonadaceae bacterium]HBX45025.1 RNA polymerase sigma-54 factor [Porphyromonadaceae bacterium]